MYYTAKKIGGKTSMFKKLALIYALLFALILPNFGFAAVRDEDELDGDLWTKFGIQTEIMPDVTMIAGALVTDDGRILWSRNLDEQRSIGSIVKVMTGILAVENLDMNEEIILPAMPISYVESRAHLRKGDVLTGRQLLQALMLPSGNDAAIAVAVAVSGDLSSFVDLMNERAQELGMTNTQFRNASGMDHGEQFSTARDVATMSRFAMSLPEFRTAVGMEEVELQLERTTIELVNTNILLQSYDGATGIKTGRTIGAGFSHVMSAERDGLELYAVILGTTQHLTRFFEARYLLDFGFTHFREQKLALENTVVGRARVTNFPDRTVQVAMSEDVTLHVLDLAGPIEQSIEIEDGRSPIRRGDEMGQVNFVQRGRLIARVPLVATQDVDNPFFLVQWYYNAVIAWRNRSN